MSDYETGYDDGWNDALDAIMDRLNSADGRLLEMAVQKKDAGGTDYDRLRGKSSGVQLALDFARGMAMSEHKRRYLAELRSASAAIEKADAFITDPDDPEWVGVDPTKLNPGFVDYYSGLVSAGYANGFI